MKKPTAQTTFSFLRAAFLLYFLFSAFILPNLGYAQELNWKLQSEARAVRLSGGSGVSLYENRGGMEFAVGVFRSWDFSSPFVIGLDLGFSALGQGLGFQTQEQIVFRVNPTVFYEFGNDKRSAPYLGFSVGPYFFFEDETVGTTTHHRVSSAHFAVLVRPGYRFRVNDTWAFTAEPKLGFVQGHFLVAPQVSAVFSF